MGFWDWLLSTEEPTEEERTKLGMILRIAAIPTSAWKYENGVFITETSKGAMVLFKRIDFALGYGKTEYRFHLEVDGFTIYDSHLKPQAGMQILKKLHSGLYREIEQLWKERELEQDRKNYRAALNSISDKI